MNNVYKDLMGIFTEDSDDSYKGYVIVWSKKDGVYYIRKDGKVIAKVSSDKEAREFIDEMTK